MSVEWHNRAAINEIVMGGLRRLRAACLKNSGGGAESICAEVDPPPEAAAAAHQEIADLRRELAVSVDRAEGQRAQLLAAAELRESAKRVTIGHGRWRNSAMSEMDTALGIWSAATHELGLALIRTEKVTGTSNPWTVLRGELDAALREAATLRQERADTRKALELAKANEASVRLDNVRLYEERVDTARGLEALQGAVATSARMLDGQIGYEDRAQAGKLRLAMSRFAKMTTPLDVVTLRGELDGARDLAARLQLEADAAEERGARRALGDVLVRLGASYDDTAGSFHLKEQVLAAAQKVGSGALDPQLTAAMERLLRLEGWVIAAGQACAFDAPGWRDGTTETRVALLAAYAAEMGDQLAAAQAHAAAPIPMLLHCPMCHARHLDVGAWATKRHVDHACQDCGHVWRPAKVATVGVQFLPGCKNNEETTR